MTIRVEGSALSDPRYAVLALVCGLADGDHARGKVEHLWAYCTDRQTYHVPADIVRAVLGPHGVEGLVRSGLGAQNASDVEQIRICGTRGRIEWLGKLRKNAKKGGKSRQAQMGTQMGTQTPPKPDPKPSPITTAPVTVISEPEPEQDQRAPRARARAHAHAREAAPAAGSDPDPRATLRRAILAAIVPLHVETFNRVRKAVGSTARPMAVVGDPAERELVALLRDLPSLENVADDCRHVLAVREAEAISARSVRYLGASVWSAQSYARAKAMTVEEARNGFPRFAAKQAQSGFAALVAAAGGEPNDG